MLRHLLKHRSISLEHGKTTLALEPEYWNILEAFALRDGFQDWRTYFFSMLQESPPQEVPLAAWTRLQLTKFLHDELETMRFDYLPEYAEMRSLQRIVEA